MLEHFTAACRRSWPVPARRPWAFARIRSGLVLGVAMLHFPGAPPARPLPVAAPRKVALIVAIGKYPEPSIYGYARINADNDAPLIAQALESQGFLKEDMLVLTDARATRRGILGAFRSHLIDSTGPGDVVVFHYSGHGHQLTDDNGDELDGYDEVLVPYGAPNPNGRDFPADYRGEQHIRDDELNALLGELREKIGPTGQVLVLIDACFSGSATRGAYQLPVRGVATPIGPPATQRGASGGLLEATSPATRGGSAPALAPLVVISATDYDQLDHEVWGPGRTPVGPLSLAVAQTLPKVRAGMSNAAWFEQLRLVMSALVPSQAPQIEGAVDAEVLGGGLADRGPFFRVTAVMGDSLAIIAGGTLLGIQPGARVAFYGLAAVPGDPPLGDGIVTAADEVSAEVLLPVREAGKRIMASRAFVTEYGSDGLELRLAIGNGLDAGQRALVAEALRPHATIRLVEARPDLVVATGGDSAGAVVLATAADNLRLAGPFDLEEPADRDALVESIRAYARNRFLAQIEMRDPDIDVRLDLLPATHRVTGRGCESSDTTRYGARHTAGGWVFHKGDGYLLRLRNVGPQAAYVSVLELSESGLALLFPNAALRVSDNRLEPGQTYLVRDLCFIADEPYGDYVLKLFATRGPLDLAPVAASGGVARSGQSLSYVEQLLADAYQGTRSSVVRAATGTGSTQSVALRVVPRPH